MINCLIGRATRRPDESLEDLLIKSRDQAEARDVDDGWVGFDLTMNEFTVFSIISSHSHPCATLHEEEENKG